MLTQPWNKQTKKEPPYQCSRGYSHKFQHQVAFPFGYGSEHESCIQGNENENNKHVGQGDEEGGEKIAKMVFRFDFGLGRPSFQGIGTKNYVAEENKYHAADQLNE